MSNSTKVKNYTLTEIKKIVQKAAQDNYIHPSKVNLAMLKAQDPNITEWALRQFGGINSIRKNFPITDKDLAAIKEQEDLKSYVNKLEKQLGDQINLEQKILATIDLALSNVGKSKYKIKPLKINKKAKPMAMELMLSDIHFGKKSKSFSLNVLRERLMKLRDIFLAEMTKKNVLEGYQVRTVVLALIGDIIESYSMHGAESSSSCEFGNSKQMQEAIDGLFDLVILPIAQSGVKVHIPAVAGNHDRTEKNRTFNYPGETYVTWVIYNSLKRYCQLAGLTNVTFDIPVDNYTTYDLFGKYTILYEHLDNINSPTKNILDGLIKKRERQIEKRISMLRGGHWHEYVCYDRGRIIVNESVCGQDSYAKVNGYASSPGQVINFYVDDNSLPNGFLYSYPVYLG